MNIDELMAHMQDMRRRHGGDFKPGQTIEEQCIQYMRDALVRADDAFMIDFIERGPVGSVDGNARYLLAVALHRVTNEQLAAVAGISVPAAEVLKYWLKLGTRK